MYNTYIIESSSFNRWYIGHTNDVERRIIEHNFNHTRSTRNKGQWKLIFKRSFESKAEAIEFEYKLKKAKK